MTYPYRTFSWCINITYVVDFFEILVEGKVKNLSPTYTIQHPSPISMQPLIDVN